MIVFSEQIENICHCGLSRRYNNSESDLNDIRVKWKSMEQMNELESKCRESLIFKKKIEPIINKQLEGYYIAIL